MRKGREVVVVQRGARRRYAIPGILNQLGVLDRVITDSHRDSRLGNLLSLIPERVRLPAAVGRLRRRNLLGTGVPRSRVCSIDSWIWHEWRLSGLRQRNAGLWLRRRDEIWYKKIRRFFAGCEGHTLLYSMNGENLLLLEEAAAKGAHTVVDVFISPFNLRESCGEKTALGIRPSAWEAGYEEVERHYLNVYRAAGTLLCPSQWVAGALRRLDPGLASKIIVSPYGSSIQPGEKARKPQKGRIFWAGSDWCRKGLHYLAGAAEIIRAAHPGYEFRAAGITDPAVTGQERFRQINFVGKLSRSGMENEFLTADLFVLPTLSEGMAGVVIEAISAGCPVMTTEAAGVDGIEDGVSGVILKSRDPAYLAAEILNLCGEREKITAMARETARLAGHYTEGAWKDRLGALIESLP